MYFRYISCISQVCIMCEIRKSQACLRHILPHLAPSWILSRAENLASTSLQEGATKWHNSEDTTQPPAVHLFLTDPITTGSLF